MNLETISVDQLKAEIQRRTDFQTLVYTLHSFLCTKDHNSSCSFYAEQQMAEEWELPDHQRWISETTAFVMRYESDASTILRSFYRVATLIDTVARLGELEQRLFLELSPMLIDLP